MERAEDVAWHLRGLLDSKYRLDYVGKQGCWIDKLTDKTNTPLAVVLIECGGVGVADRLRESHRRAKELGVPLKVLNGSQAAGDWAASLKSATSDKSHRPQKQPPVRWLDMAEMDSWLERFYPRRKQVFRSGY